jgi:hypothetical protein
LRNEEALRTPRAPAGRVNKMLFSKYKPPQEEPKITLMNNRNLKIQSFKPPLEVTQEMGTDAQSSFASIESLGD